MRRATVAALLAVAALATGGCGGDDSAADATTEPTGTTDTSTGGSSGTALAGSVGPGFEISVDKPAVAAGTYALTVDDQASSHNFHLTGPGGVDVSTDVGGTGQETFSVELEPGTYTFVCDPHSSSMKGTLTVT